MNTSWSRSIGLSSPIVCAPMGGAAGGRLASAVSLAGGLGMIGMGSAASVPLLERELALLDHSLVNGERPFGIGLVDWVSRQDEALIHRAIAARPTLISVSFGETYEWTAPVRAARIISAAQVANAEEARRAAAAGVDVIVARGAEGGGHGSPELALLPLLEAVLSAVDVPVLAAGGLSSAHSIAAALAAGAAGAWVGTAFLACPESLFSDAARSEIFAARGADTVLSSAGDAALGYAWPARFPERVLRTSFTERWSGHEVQLRDDPAAQTQFRAALDHEDYSIVPLNAGQGVDSVTIPRSPAEVIAVLTAALRSRDPAQT